MNRHDLSKWPDLLDKMTDMLPGRGPVQMSGSDYSFRNIDDNRRFSDDFEKIAERRERSKKVATLLQ
jgi:hypothetical protein